MATVRRYWAQLRRERSVIRVGRARSAGVDIHAVRCGPPLVASPARSDMGNQRVTTDHVPFSCMRSVGDSLHPENIGTTRHPTSRQERRAQRDMP